MLGKGIVSFRDHNMIYDPNVDQTKRRLELIGNVPVGLARLRYAGRVIVAQDARRRVMGEGVFHDLSGIDACAVNRASKQCLEGYEAMLVIEP